MKLSIINIGKYYDTVQALDNISIDIESGGVFGLIGPNGAGKSTLMKILTTLEKPSTGNVLLDDCDIVKNPNHMRKILGYLPQDVAVYPHLSAVEFLTYMAAIKGLDKKSAKRQIEELLQTLNLSNVQKERLQAYSGGMRQRVGIACALLGDPKIIIADEPSIGLDPEERIVLRKLFRKLAKTRIVLLSTHIISDIESTATQLAMIQSGKLLFKGTPESFSQHTSGDMEAAYLRIIHAKEGAQ